MSDLLAPPFGASAPSDPLGVAVSERDADTLSMVETALKTRNVRLAYQPVMATGNPSAPAFYEGLIRVLDPTGRVIPAGEFMGAVEANPMGREIDCAALELGLNALRMNPTLRLAINMSARSVGYAPWMRTLESGLENEPTIGERLILEITESSAMLIPDVVRAFMDELQLKGICFALDDFGAGFTAFRHLRDFYFDIIKIDGEFIRDIARSPDNQVLTRALISIGAHFEMFTVAESVENANDAAWLTAAGVDGLQGYHFGAPALNPAWEDMHSRQTG